MNTELQAKAKKMFFQTNLSKTEIADALAVPRRTLHHWIRQHDWDIEKEAMERIPELVAANCLQIMLRLTDKLLSEERADMPITLREADTLYKLTMTMNKLKKTPVAKNDASVFVDADLERRLDSEDIKAWENEMEASSVQQPSIADMRKAVGFHAPSDRRRPSSTSTARPSYEQFIDSLQQQDKHLRHLFPPVRFSMSAAA